VVRRIACPPALTLLAANVQQFGTSHWQLACESYTNPQWAGKGRSLRIGHPANPMDVRGRCPHNVAAPI